MFRKFITAAITAFALMAVAAPPASADWGDWWTQRQKTQNHMGSSWTYWDSYVIEGSHSRRFNYRYVYYHNGQCYADYYYMKISHNYIIWDQDYFAGGRWC